MSPLFQLCLDCSGGRLKTTPSSLLSSSSAHCMDSYLLYVAIGSSVPLGIRPLSLFLLFLFICFVFSATGGLFTVSLLLSLIFFLPFFVCFTSLFASGFGAVGVAAVVVAIFVFLLITGCLLAGEVSLLVLGFAEEDPGVAKTFVALHQSGNQPTQPALRQHWHKMVVC